MKPEIAEQIARQEPFFRPVITVPDGVELQRGELNGVEVEWTIPSDGVKDETLTVLYTHGGGYSGGLAAWARRATARLAKKLGCKVVAPDYRLAPFFPFPAAHEDVLAVYRWLVKNGFTRIALAGDSAGGSLATSLALDAIHEGLPAPIAVCTNSLWADIAMNTPSLDDPIKNKHDIRKEMVIQLNKAFLMPGGIDPMGPRHSPVYRDLHGLPPLLLQAAGLDICHDDSVRLAANAKAAGVKVKYTEYPNCDHIWILNGPCKIRYADDYPVGPCEFYVAGDEPKEAEEAIDEMVAWIRENDRR